MLSKPIYESVERMAEFPGGVIEMEKYVLQHLRPPAGYQVPRSTGVYTRFIVSDRGVISDVRIVRGSGNPAFDDSVKAVIRRMPAWKPAMVEGNAVNSFYNLPMSGFRNP